VCPEHVLASIDLKSSEIGAIKTRFRTGLVTADPALGLEEIRSVDCRAAADEVLRAEMVSVVELGLL
jgi:hypothetical protein